MSPTAMDAIRDHLIPSNRLGDDAMEMARLPDEGAVDEILATEVAIARARDDAKKDNGVDCCEAGIGGSVHFLESTISSTTSPTIQSTMTDTSHQLRRRSFDTSMRPVRRFSYTEKEGGESQHRFELGTSVRSARPGLLRRDSSIAGDVIHESIRRTVRLPAYITEMLEEDDKNEEINRTSMLLANVDGEDADEGDGIECAVEAGDEVAENGRRPSLTHQGSTASIQGRGKRFKKSCGACCSGQVKKMRTTADWWNLWIGLASFAIAIVLVFIVPYDISSKRARYVVPRPMRWESNPLDAWDWYALVGSVLLLSCFCSLYLLAMLSMGKLAKNPVGVHARGFFWMGIIATLSLWIGSNRWCSLNGMSYAIWSILFGMIVTNSPLGNLDMLKALKVTSKDGEFFIKCSLTLLATEFSILAEVGWQAIVVTWVGSPLALILGYVISRKLLKIDVNIALLTSVGATWCGASAISATGSVIEASSADITLSISVVAFFTVIFTFVQPYIALGVGMDEAVAGSWIGASVDQTGNVVASAAIISEYATEVAGIVKIILNSGLGILCTIIAFWWQTKTRNDGTKFSWLYLWDKFPKFVLGYFFCSGLLSTMLHFMPPGTAEADAIQRAVIDMNKWWFALGFVGIGVGTNLKELYHGAARSGVVQGYLVSNLLDIGIALGLSYALFK